MAKKMDEIVKYLKASPYRRTVLDAVGTDVISPQKIRAKTNLDLSTIIYVVRSLKSKGLIKHLGKTGKQELYETTELGKAALQMKNQRGSYKWKGTSQQRRISRRVTK